MYIFKNLTKTWKIQNLLYKIINFFYFNVYFKIMKKYLIFKK